MAFRQILILVVFVAGLFAVPASWAFEVGDWVAVRRNATLIAAGQRVDQVTPGQVLRVLAVGKGQVWVSRGRPGWIATANLVVVAEANKLFEQATGRLGARDLLARGRVRLAAGKLEAGLVDLNRAAELASQNGEFLAPLGFGYLAAGHPETAIKVFSAALDKQPQSVEAWMGRGLAYSQTGNANNARSDFAQAIKLDPLHAFPRKHLGALLHDQGQLDAAEQALTKAIELDAHDGFARKAMGRLRFDQGNLEAARDAFSIAIKLDNKDTEALTGRGVVRHAMGDLKAAEADYLAAIEAAEALPDNAFMWSNLGQVQMELGKFSEALKNLNKAIQLDPEFNEARSHRAFLLVTQPAARQSATASVQQAAADMRQVFQSKAEKTFWDYRALAAVSAQRGDNARAAGYQAQAVEQVQQNGPKRFVEPAIEALKRYQTQ
ncbi:tetratricopeptide repeat protein [Roseimaritima ulvae]|uniref:Lipoprotein NlpI n=1 Tax=Roseimaritima ulvae TaxID=980254 RepID=A0A5B9R2H8_9BACT|nr:tetratricopeptide repeat protein [Roseimaritima ulvae]QEG43616.1 lipoprotein NlpI [Roseimaritima ulvae]